MASHEHGGDSPSPPSDASDQLPRSEVPRPPSVISSRMTDIASEDGGEGEVQRRPSQRKSAAASESRPGTAKTGVSSRGAWPQPQPLRKNYLSGLAAKRGSIGSGSVAGSIGRTPSTKSRSHVPSLQSHAFFHPMSSQKLQAQRGGARPLTMTQPVMNEAGESGGQMAAGNSMGRLGRPLSDDGEPQQPPSPGTEMTGQETLDRITANTSPTHGHHPQGSLTESMRPLQKKTGTGEHRGLQVQTDKSYMERPNNPSPLKSPRSFRSSFLMPGKENAQKNGSNRNLDGAEKLSSGASSPQLERMDASAKAPPKATTKLGRVWEYFQGNTVFCLGGRWQNTRSKPVNVATGLLVVVPGVLYCIFSAPWQWNNISPAIPIVFAYLFCVCFSSFVHASVSDPGVSALTDFASRYFSALLTWRLDPATKPPPVPTT